MQIDIQTAGDHAATQLRALHSKECGRPDEASNSVAVTLLKVLTIIAGIFFSMVSATSLPPDLAFISITLITVTVAAIVTGSEKIVAIFPRNIWIWRSHYPAPTVVDYHQPHSYTPRGFFRRAFGRGPANVGGHPVHTTTSAGGRRGHPGGAAAAAAAARRTSSPVRRAPNRPLSSSAHAAAGGGHVGSPYAGGTPGNVAVGSGQHDRRPTTPSGNVIPGSRR
ncbi:MAG: hypothetical protein P0S96_04030 [Simkaniaceae bacterium]|nr:hypothetical protein [Candidatus Sacchlamyda saccharinae]